MGMGVGIKRGLGEGLGVGLTNLGNTLFNAALAQQRINAYDRRSTRANMLKWINQYGAQPVSDKAVPSPVNVEAVAQPALAHFANLDPARAGIPSQFPAQNFSEPSIDASLLGGSSDSGADATRTETAKSWEEIGGA